jgi:hypothetical protein
VFVTEIVELALECLYYDKVVEYIPHYQKQVTLPCIGENKYSTNLDISDMFKLKAISRLVQRVTVHFPRISTR